MEKNTLMDSLRRNVVRLGLEAFQGRMKSDLLGTDPESSRERDENVEEMLNIPYINRVGVPLAMDIFRPLNTVNKELPVIVMIHGGGLVMGDRSLSRSLSVCLARRGYLVFSIEYRLAPRANVCEQLDDICAGLNLIGEKLVDFDVDFTRMFMVAESAGAFLATYVAAMKKSKKLQEAIGYEPSRMQFKALGLMSGMYYMKRPDPVGMLLAEQFFGDKQNDENFMEYMDPENPEIIGNLPPVFMVTSKGDFLNQYTLMFHNAMKDYGKETHLLYYGDDTMDHSYPAYHPTSEKGSEVLDKMTAWFEEQADAAAKKFRRKRTDKSRAVKLEGRISDGSITDQRIWKFITEMNSISDDRLDTTALIAGSRRYTYRRMFREWERYAKVFTSLEINKKNHSRVGIFSAITAEIIFSFYALNMVGASSSFLCLGDIFNDQYVRDTIKVEGLTDLILVDYCTTPGMLKKFIEWKEELGLRNIIVLHSDAEDPFTSEAVLRSCKFVSIALKKIEGASFMEDLLDQCEETEITYGRYDSGEASVIVHTSGTTKGIHKPIPLSDKAVNAAVSSLAGLEQYQPLMGNAVSILSIVPSNAYGVVDQIHLSLAFGCSTVILPMGLCNMNFPKALEHYEVNILFITAGDIEGWAAAAGAGQLKIDFSSLKQIIVGGMYLSAEAKKRINDFIAENGGTVRITNGYGLSETGGACIVAPPEREDDAIGYPLPGVKVKIFDEENKIYYNIEDGPRTGLLYLSADSLSSGKLDDNVFFELDNIDGVPYLCTYDMVTVNEDKSLTYIGRTDRFYTNNEGIRFDAGLVETSINGQSGIEECAVIPFYDKMLHDTVPGLCLKLADSENPAETVRTALKNCFIEQDHFKESNIPCMCIIADELPHNASGKVDIYRLTKGEIQGKHYRIDTVKSDDKLTDITLTFLASDDFLDSVYSMPEELDKGVDVYSTGNLILLMIAMTSMDLVVFPYYGFWDYFMKESMPEIYQFADSLGRRPLPEMAALFQKIQNLIGFYSAKLEAADAVSDSDEKIEMPAQASEGDAEAVPSDADAAENAGAQSAMGGLGAGLGGILGHFFNTSHIDYDFED